MEKRTIIFIVFILICFINVLFIYNFSNKSAHFPEENIHIKWVFPVKIIPKDSSLIYNKANDIIKTTYKNYIIDFIPILESEYSSKIVKYFSVDNSADIIWFDDNLLYSLSQISSDDFKRADLLLDYAPNINEVLKDFIITDNLNLNYGLPLLANKSGLVPYLKIPKQLSEYIDINKLVSLSQSSTNISSIHLDIIDDYLNNVYKSKKIQNGINVYALKDILPLIGYEPIFSTSNLIVNKLDDYSRLPLNLLSQQSYLDISKYIEGWYDKGYIREDINVVKNLSQFNGYEFILSAVWGCSEDTITTLLNDYESNNYIYIPLSNYYHSQIKLRKSNLLFPQNSKHLVQSIQVLDLFYSNNELYNLLTYGILDKHYSIQNNFITKHRLSGYYMNDNIFPSKKSGYQLINDKNLITIPMKPINNLNYEQPLLSTENQQILLDYTHIYTKETTFKLPFFSYPKISNILSNAKN